MYYFVTDKFFWWWFRFHCAWNPKQIQNIGGKVLDPGQCPDHHFRTEHSFPPATKSIGAWRLTAESPSGDCPSARGLSMTLCQTGQPASNDCLTRGCKGPIPALNDSAMLLCPRVRGAHQPRPCDWHSQPHFSFCPAPQEIILGAHPIKYPPH